VVFRRTFPRICPGGTLEMRPPEGGRKEKRPKGGAKDIGARGDNRFSGQELKAVQSWAIKSASIVKRRKLSHSGGQLR
jgi:hypothetical protein